jgi:hypothetical protein
MLAPAIGSRGGCECEIFMKSHQGHSLFPHLLWVVQGRRDDFHATYILIYVDENQEESRPFTRLDRQSRLDSFAARRSEAG